MLTFSTVILRHPATVAIGCGAGTILLASAADESGASLRSGAVPLGMATLAISFGLALAQAGWQGVGHPLRRTRIAAFVAAIGLSLTAGFFLSLAALYAAGSKLLNSDTALTALGTAFASVTSLMIVPATVAVFALGLWRDLRYPLMVRVAGWLSIIALAVGLMTAAAADEALEPALQVVTFVLLSVILTWMSIGIYRFHGTLRGEPLTEGRPEKLRPQ
jgi:hypothetical protein